MELATEHVRLLDAGKLRLAYSSPLSTGCFASVASAKTQLLQHGNIYGLTFTATERGFVMTMNSELEACYIDYNRRRQEALDHGEGRLMMEIGNLPVSKEIQLPSIAYWIALSPDELLVAVAYANSVALFKVAHIVKAVSPAPFHTFAELRAQEIAWCSDLKSESVAVLTLEEQVVVCTLDGAKARIETPTVASSKWRMFFIGCSLSADIELLVSDPEGGEWELWKPLEKYQARLPMNAEDEESFPMGFALNLNSTLPVPVDEDTFSPVPIVSCSSTEGLLVNFAFVDTTVKEVEFVKKPLPFKTTVTRIAVAAKEPKACDPAATDGLQHPSDVTSVGKSASQNSTFLHNYGQNDENEFAESDSESSDEEEERKEEVERARTAFHTIAFDGANFILSDQFSKLFKAMGSTYSEEEHASTLNSLEKDGKVYEADFVSWYVSWIFGDDDSDSDDEITAPESSSAEPVKMKSKEEITAAFSRFTAKEGSWKCGVCMLDNDAEVVKCGACDASKPAAPKVETPARVASGASIGTIGSGGFSFPVSAADASKPPSLSFTASPSTAGVTNASNSGGFSFPGAMQALNLSFPSSTIASGTGFSFPPAATSFTTMNPEVCTGRVGDDGSKISSNAASAIRSDLNAIVSHEYSQNDQHGFADSGNEEEEIKEEECNARAAFRSIAQEGTDYVTAGQFRKLLTSLRLSHSDEQLASTISGLEKNGNVHEADFIACESSDEEEERKEEVERARTAFHTIAFDGANFILSDQFSKLFKAMGSTYSEEEHASTLNSLEKDGKVYEADFVSWYVSWIFGDDDSDSDDEITAPESSSAEPVKMKSKEEITAAFSRFTAKEGSWKCGVCMLDNDAEVVKCGACDASKPAAPKVETPARVASGASIGTIGSGGFSFPVSAADASKPPSLSFTASPSTAGVTNASNSGGFSFPGAVQALNLSFPSSTIASGTGFSFPPAATSATGLCSGAAENLLECSSVAGEVADPLNTTSKPKPPTASNSSYPPDTTLKPKPPTASNSSYPPDTTSKPKPPTASNSSYPPDTTSKPKPPTASNSSYPPDTTSKPKPPTASNSSYSPDTTSKPKPPTASNSSYPPDTTSKPKPPTASNSSYFPDTTSKPKPPTASNSSYFPETTLKPKPPAFGTASNSSYPPDTLSKRKPPTFGTVSTSGYPPDTASKPKPLVFGHGTMPEMKTSSSLFPIGRKTFGSQSKSFARIDPSVRDSNLTSAVAPAESKNRRESAFGSDVTTGAAARTSSSPFGVVPKSSSQEAFSFGLAKASDSNDVTGKSNVARPSLSFSSWSSTLDPSKDHDGPEDQPPTKRTLNFEDCRALEAKATSIPMANTNAKPLVDPAESCISIPSSPMEGQLWKLIVNFDKSLQRLNQCSTKIPSNNPELSLNCMAKVDKIRLQISDFCMTINDLDELRDQVEKDVLFVIGSDGDVHEQLEYGREMLNSFNDEALKRTLEMQPLDQRSQQTWESLKVKLAKVKKCCLELDSHLSSSKIGAAGFGAESSAHLFRVLKQTYDKSKMQYNEVFKLTEHLKELKVGGDRMHRMNGVAMTTAVDSEAHSIATKADMIQMIVETGERRQDTRLSVASPVSSAKQSPMSVSFKNTPFKSGSKLSSLAEAMVPKEEAAKLVQTPHSTRASVSVGKASQRPSLRVPAAEMKPVSKTSSTAQSSNVFSFPKSSKETATSVAAFARIGDGKTGSNSLSSSNFGVNVPTVKAKLGAEARPTSALSLGGKSSPKSPPTFSFGNAKGGTQPLSTTPVTVDYKALLEKFYKVHNPLKIDGGMMDKALITYKGKEKDLFTRLFSMYVPGSTPDDVTKYLGGGPVPPKSEHGATTVKAVKPAAESPFAASPSAQASPFTSTSAQTSPFGAPPSAFSLNPAANKASGFGGFGSTPATSSLATPTLPAPSFGKPAVDYRQKLVDFYQKYNPSKLSSVDATLQKYKGNEEKLFQSLATKYKVDVSNVSGVSVLPASPAVQPAKPNAAASPFGKPGAFSAPITSSGPSFGSTSSVGFGGTPSPAATPFGTAATPASSPFGAPSSQSAGGFGSAGFGSGFQSTPTTTSSPFGATTTGFGATTGGGFGAVTSGGLGATPSGSNYREKLTAFYQQHNPAKLSSVDATLEKYRGREDHLFAMLEQKYMKKIPVTAPATGGFGIPSTSTFGGGGASGFGTPSSLGVASPVPAFGSASALGAAAQSVFGGAAGLGFGGMGSQMSRGFGSAAPAAGTGFGFQLPSFGGATQQSSGFGTAARGSSGFGSGFESSAATGSFDKPAAFNSASFTQMQ
uniref:RanBP2-type domain-containing protein n=1 Tax=Hyaloperonospora arabidopsidis (strain Emoy2) TaxID=559515 RepID=M4B520_HYAAE